MGKTSDIFVEDTHIFGRKFYGRVQKCHKIVAIFSFVKWANGQKKWAKVGKWPKSFVKNLQTLNNILHFGQKKWANGHFCGIKVATLFNYFRYILCHFWVILAYFGPFSVHFVSFLGDFWGNIEQCGQKPTFFSYLIEKLIFYIIIWKIKWANGHKAKSRIFQVVL